MSDCLTDATLAQNADRSMDTIDPAIRGHLDACPACRDRWQRAGIDGELFGEIAAASRERPAIDRSLPAEAVPGYSIEAEIHRGGQGVVYRARQLSTRREVALKLLLKGRFATPRELHRFEREVELLATLRHPNIVTVHDSGVIDGRPYYAMELIEGRTLDRFVEELGPVRTTTDVRERLRLFRTIASAVAHAHGRGAIHRDLKPQNVLVDSDGTPHVLDFGLAKLAASEGSPAESLQTQCLQTQYLQTQSGEFLGTLAYAAPEQTRGEPDAIDARTDVYALGVILHELLTGTLPYPIDGPLSEVVRNINDRAPTPPTRIAPVIDGEVETIIATALAKEPERRYGSVAQLTRDVERYLDGFPIDAKRDSSWYVLRKTLRRNRTVVVTAIAFVLLIATALVVAIVLQQNAAHERDRANRESARAEERTYVARVVAADRALRLFDGRDAKQQLAAAPEALRDWEWHYLWSRLDRSDARAVVAAEGLDDLALGRDGDRLVVASADGHVHVLGAEDFQLQASHPFSERPRAVACGPGDRFVVGLDDGSVQIHAFDSGELLQSLTGATGPIQCLAWSLDGQRVAAGWGSYPDGASGVHVWRVDTDAVEIETAEFAPSVPYYVLAIAFAPDSRRLITGSLDAVLWDVDRRKALRTWRGHESWITSVAFHSTAETVATGSADQTVRVWSYAGEPVAVYRGHTNFIRAVRFTNDGKRLVSSGRDRTLRVWDVATGDVSAILWGHTEAVLDLELDAENRAVSCSLDRTVRRWVLESAEETRQWSAHGNAIHGLAFDPTGRTLATTGADGAVNFWGFATGERTATLELEPDLAYTVSFDPTGRDIVTAAKSGVAKLWDAATYREQHVIEGHTDRVFSVAFTPDGAHVATADEKGLIQITEVASGEVESTLDQGGCVHGLDFDATGDRLVCLGHGELVLWRLDRRERLWSLPGATGSETMPVRFGPDGRWLFAANHDAEVRIIDVARGEVVTTIGEDSESISALAVNPTGTRLATATLGGDLRLWSLPGGEPISVLLSGYDSYINALTFDPIGASLVAGCYDGTVHVWSTGTPSVAVPSSTER